MPVLIKKQSFPTTLLLGLFRVYICPYLTSKYMFCYKSVFIFVHFYIFHIFHLDSFWERLKTRKYLLAGSEMWISRDRITGTILVQKKKSSSINFKAGCKQILFSLGSNKKSPSLSCFFFSDEQGELFF